MNPVLSRRLFALSAAAAALLPATLRAQAKITLRYGNAGNAQTLSNHFNAKLFDAVTAKTDGTLAFAIFAGTLGGEQKLLESMALGSLGAARVSS